MPPARERDLYPKLAAWLRDVKRCYETGTDTGLKNARIDAVGIRDVGGHLSGASEVIAIEAKRGVTPFGNAVGQAHSYSAYADRCYLADVLPFDDEKIRIASHLGIGLLLITENGRGARQVKEVLTAPLSQPLEGLRLEVVEKLGYSFCTICKALFRRGQPGGNWSENVARSGIRKGALLRAVENESGLVYWLDEAGRRDPRTKGKDIVRTRRYVCPDCVWSLFRDFTP